MTYDDARAPADVKFGHAGQGLHQSFKCGQCQKPRSMIGRRLVKVRLGMMKGLRAWCCAECASEEVPA
jgi:hypothetical protein